MERNCNNTKEHIKWVICGANVFLLFWLHLDSQSFKTVRKFYLPHSLVSLLSWLEWWCKQILKLLVILHVALFHCLSIIIDYQNNSFHEQVGSGIILGQTSTKMKKPYFLHVDTNSLKWKVDQKILAWAWS